MFDQEGKRYLDMFAGIVTVSLGHSHPRIVEAITRQASTLMHTAPMYANNEVAQYAEELLQRFPDHLDTVFFANSGSEANDLALRLARMYTGNYTIMSVRHGYHGMSGLTTALTATEGWKHNLPEPFGIERSLCPDTYKGAFTGDDAIAKYLKDFREVVNTQTSGSLAGFICEPVQGVGGCVNIPDDYLQKVYEITRQAGGVCISDEVQTGFHRTGSNFCGFQLKGVTPDIVVCAKAIANGMPLAAVITRKEIADSVVKNTLNTFGGNPIASAVGREVLKIIDDENIAQNVQEVGEYLTEGILYLKDKYEIIGDVRGAGLMIGVELVTNRETKDPNLTALLNIFERTKDLGLLIGKTQNVFRIKPPLIVNKRDCDFAVDVLDKAFAEEQEGLLKWF
mmetsp:Transcript_23396/g.26552  ORF Transcript_23396/g.26552 Transcript_23396/m.26552 type:complete len:396 (+) Transcript_23396:35-1222(+)